MSLSYNKNLFFSLSYLMFIISLLSTVIMYLMDNWIINFSMNPFCLFPFSISLVFDLQSSIFISTVSTVTLFIFIYSFYYLKDSEMFYSLKKFLVILFFFVISMFILSLSGNLFWVMIGWDGLGVSSFCLIFFYQNWKSFGSSMVTFLSNRFGDILIIFSISVLIMSGSIQSWIPSGMGWMFSLLIGGGAFSKSAQLPYSFWLPQAMAAPTPVSALVHSSTLVTAGVFIFCRFNFLIDNSSISLLFLIVSFVTMIVAGMSSLMEFDIKKIIAFSTLCHVSLMMVFSVLKDVKASLFHLMMHAFFKSLLFMIAGYLIHESINSQDIRYIGEPMKNMFIGIPFFISTFSMMGFPFLSGFYSKELMLVNLSYWNSSIVSSLMFMINSFFSCAYSIRLMKMIFMDFFKKSIFMFKFSEYGNLFIASTAFSSFVGGLSSMMLVEDNPPTKELKAVLAIFCFIGVIVGLNNYSMIFLPKELKFIMLSMWKLNNFYKIFQKYFFMISSSLMWKVDEKGSLKNFSKEVSFFFLNFSKLSSMIFLLKPFSFLKFIHLIVLVSWVLMSINYLH